MADDLQAVRLPAVLQASGQESGQLDAADAQLPARLLLECLRDREDEVRLNAVESFRV